MGPGGKCEWGGGKKKNKKIFKLGGGGGGEKGEGGGGTLWLEGRDLTDCAKGILQCTILII